MLNSVASKGGSLILTDLQRELIAAGPNKRNVIKTNAYQLPCQFVLHLDISKSRKKFVETVVEAFVYAGELNAITVAVPCFGKSKEFLGTLVDFFRGSRVNRHRGKTRC